MKITLTIADCDGHDIRQAEILIGGKPATPGVCSDVEEALLGLLHKWKYGRGAIRQGAEVHYVFKSV